MTAARPAATPERHQRPSPISAGPISTRLARRRLVAYTALSDLIADLERVEASHRAGTLRQLGNRAPGQLFGHLAISMRASVTGLDSLRNAAPLWLRVIGPFVKKRVLTTPLRPGMRFRSEVEAVLWDETLTFEDGLASLRTELARFADASTRPRASHPILGPLSPEEWRSFHLRHAELHMSFLQP